MNLKTALSVWPQYLLPHHALSQLMSKLTHCETPWWKNAFIKLIIRLYQVNLNEARYPDLNHYPSFNAFFTRELADGVRPLSTETHSIACPADGAISQIGRIDQQQIFQAKGHQYSIEALLGGDLEWSQRFSNGSFATIYLSPRDYHRLHMPVDGILKRMIHVPGRLFSVNNTTVSAVPGLFARNERVVCLYETAQGPMALILVGAIFVSSIETVWHGVVTPPTIQQTRSWDYEETGVELHRGTEMGRFNMGSTIIVLFGENQVDWLESLSANTPVKLGQAIGHKR